MKSYPFSIEPYRLVEMVWPNVCGIQYEGNSYWADVVRIPGVYPKIWVPSLYLGVLTVVLGFSALALQEGPALARLAVRDPGREPARKFGQVHEPDLGGSRARRHVEVSDARAPRRGTGPGRRDRHRADPPGRFSPRWRRRLLLVVGDGSAGLPAVPIPRQAVHVHHPGAGCTGRRGVGPNVRGAHPRNRCPAHPPLGLELAVFAGVVIERQPILAAFRPRPASGTFGPFDAAKGYQAILGGLAHGGDRVGGRG